MQSPLIKRAVAKWLISPNQSINYKELSVCNKNGRYFVGAMYQEPGKWPALGTIESATFDSFKECERWFKWVLNLPNPEDWLQGKISVLENLD